MWHIRASFLSHLCLIQVSSTPHSCLIHASFMPHPCLIHASFMPHSCLIYASFMPHSCLIHASFMPHSCLIHASFMPHSCLIHASFMGRKVGTKQNCDKVNVEVNKIRSTIIEHYCQRRVHTNFIKGKKSSEGNLGHNTHIIDLLCNVYSLN